MLATRLKRRVQGWARQAVLAVVGLVLCLAGFVLFLAALHLSLSSLVRPVVSAILLGCALLIVGLVFLLVANRPVGQPPPAMELSGGSNPSEIESGQAGRTVLRSPVLQAAGIGLLAGMVLGRKRRKRGRRRS